MRQQKTTLRRRHAGLLAACAGCLAVLALAAVAVAMVSRQPAHPRLALLRHDPVSVRGQGFAGRSRVLVALSVERVSSGARSHLTRRVRATRSGTFTATFPVAVDRCTAWSVRASTPHRAPALLRGPKPMCAPAATP